MLTQSQAAPLLGQGAAIDHLGPRFGQWPFAQAGKFFIQLARQDQLQHGVTEKFQTLIVLDRGALFVGDRGMRQGKAQQIFVPEQITETGLESVESGHGKVFNKQPSARSAVPRARIQRGPRVSRWFRWTRW